MTEMYSGNRDRWMDARLDYAARKKNILAAYALWICFGLIGAHRIYLDRRISGFVMLALSLSVVGLVVTAVWWLIDLFLVPFMTEGANYDIRRDVGA